MKLGWKCLFLGKGNIGTNLKAQQPHGYGYGYGYGFVSFKFYKIIT